MLNPHLQRELQSLGLWSREVRDAIIAAGGSVQGLTQLPEHLREVFKTAWEVKMRSLIDLAADRGAFIDQSQSLNLFLAEPSFAQVSSMHFYAWQKGLKTGYAHAARTARPPRRRRHPGPARQTTSLADARSCAIAACTICGRSRRRRRSNSPSPAAARLDAARRAGAGAATSRPRQPRRARLPMARENVRCARASRAVCDLERAVVRAEPL